MTTQALQTTKEVYCPVYKLMFNMQGEIKEGTTGLQEIHIRTCSNEPHCTQMSNIDCRVHKVLQTGKW